MAETLPVRTEQAIVALPEALRALARERTVAVLRAAPTANQPAIEAAAGTLACVVALSDFIARAIAADPALLPDLVASGDLNRGNDPQALSARARAAVAGAADENTLKRALRRLRRREMLRIAWRDLGGLADLNETLAMLSALADACVGVGVDHLTDSLRAECGVPRVPDGTEAKFVVLALGKLGGGELNFSSDIDLMFAYSDDGETGGSGASRPLSNHEFFLRLGQRLIAVLNDITEDGFVFRVDMRLRPHGASGPLAMSFDAMELYYQTHGREWERYALIKARAIAGDIGAGDALIALLQPFVFRRYLDYGAIEAIHELKQKIESELRRRGIESNIKLGPGGIREIEFIGQALQLVRGGREPALRARAIRPVLALLGERKLLPPEAVAELDAAYVFLRNAENRLQMQDDRQTHVLPDDPLARSRLAAAMGFDDWTTFTAALARHMHAVHARFEALFASPRAALPDDPLAGAWHTPGDAASATAALANAGFRDPPAALQRLAHLREGGSLRALSADGRVQLDRLMPHLIAAAARTPDADVALARLTRVIEAIGRRPAYFALLSSHPLALSQLARLLAASHSITDWLAQHPILLDELVDTGALYAPVTRAGLAHELERLIAALPAEDLGARMDRMREFRQAQTLRTAACHLDARLDVEGVCGRLSDLAEVMVAGALTVAGAEHERAHGRPRCADMTDREPGFAVIAYGKLGSRELGYGADLDMIFLYEDCDDPDRSGGQSDGTRPLPNETWFARLAQRIIHVLTTRTAAGLLYPVDMRLRPNGASGLLVTSLSAFRRYQFEQAWTWEQQALIRARAVAGDTGVAGHFESVRAAVLVRPRDADALATEVRAMRARMRDARQPAPAGLFDIKHDAGGLIDIEFMVQYLVLRCAARHTEILAARGSVALLGALAVAGELSAAHTQVLTDAYRHYLSLDLRQKLGEASPDASRTVPLEAAGAHPAQVRKLWQTILNDRGT